MKVPLVYADAGPKPLTLLNLIDRIERIHVLASMALVSSAYLNLIDRIERRELGRSERSSMRCYMNLIDRY